MKAILDKLQLKLTEIEKCAAAATPVCLEVHCNNLDGERCQECWEFLKSVYKARTTNPAMARALRVAVELLQDFSEFNPRGPHDYFQSKSEAALAAIAKKLDVTGEGK